MNKLLWCIQQVEQSRAWYAAVDRGDDVGWPPTLVWIQATIAYGSIATAAAIIWWW